MGQNNNYWHVLNDVGSTPQGKEAREKALKKQQNAKKKKAKSGKKVQQAVATCPYANQGGGGGGSSSTAPVQQIIPCKYTNMKVSKDGGGSIVASSRNNVKILEVVAGSLRKSSTINCELVGISGPCDTHKDKTYSYSEKYVEKTSSKLTINVYSSLTRISLPWKASPVRYHINANTCEKRVKARVDVFPDTELEFTLGLNLNTEVEHSESGTKHETKSAVAIKGTYKHDGSEYSIETDFEEILKQIKRLTDLKNNFTRLMNYLGDSKAVNYLGHTIVPKKAKLEIKWPSLEMGLSGKWEEDGAECKYKGKLSLGFSPLLGAEVEIDLAAMFFNATPAGVIKRVLDMANLETFQLLFKIGGEISGKVSVEIEREKETKYTPKGSIEGKLPVSVEAVLLKTKGKYFWILDVDAEASIAAESGISASVEATKGSSDVPAEVKFSGLNVYLVLKGSVGISLSSNTPPPGAEEGGKDDDDDKPNENKLFLFGIDERKIFEHTFTI